MRPALLLAVAVFALLALGGCQADSVSFKVNNATAGAGGTELNLNDEIAIQFSEPVDATTVSVEAFRVTDANGRRLPIRVRPAGDTVYVASADQDGWPADARLAVEVPHTWLGRPIRSSQGSVNDATFRTEIRTGRRYGPRGGTLKLVYHSLPFSDGTDVTEGAEFLFELDGPVDRSSLPEGITLHDVSHGESVTHFSADLVSPRRISVVPFAGQGFRSGTRYRLTLTGALRGEDTRKLGAPASFTFTTTRSRSGEHATDFRREHLVDPSLKPEKGPLTPLLYAEQREIGQGAAHQQAAPFGKEPSKVQILIPGEALLNEGAPDDAIITAMSFRVFGAEPASLRLSARLDYAADSHEYELGRDFEENWNLPATRHRDLLGAEGDLHVLDPSEGVLTFVFPKPFFYESNGKARALVLEIVNESGILNDSAGVVIRGEDAGRPIRFIESADGSAQAAAHGFVPALTFVLQRPRPVPLRPWTAATVGDPEYFRRQDQFAATPGFMNFRVQYRIFEPGMDPASSEGYRLDLSQLSGHRTIQARIVFILRSADPVPKDAGLLRLTVPFRERGTE
jgi:hypothetical protein